jgi:CRP-like cAMP-binding protein
VIISDGELIDETVAKCFVQLSHHQMLEITKNLEKFEYAPGEIILSQDESVNYLYMIVSGEVEISLHGQKGKRHIITHLNANQFFGEIELAGGGSSIANVSASQDSPVKLVAIKHEKFLEIMQKSPLTQEVVQKIVQLRIDENRSARQKLNR